MRLQRRTDSSAYKNLDGNRLQPLTSKRAADLKLEHDSSLERVVDRLLCDTVGQSAVDGQLDDINVGLPITRKRLHYRIACHVKRLLVEWLNGYQIVTVPHLTFLNIK